MTFRLIFCLSAYLLLSSKSCRNNSADSKMKDTVNIQVLEATSQSWAGGMEESGRGYEYVIKLLVPGYNSQYIKFDSMWVNKVVLPLRISPAEDKGDTVILHATERKIPPKILKSKEGEGNILKDMNSPAAEPPIRHEGEAVIKYSRNGKNDFVVIQKFHKLQSINYPSMKRE